MNIRFYNGRILTTDTNEKNFILIGEVWVFDNKINYVGEKRDDANLYKFDEEINLEENLLMPGFKNCHTHSAMTFLRSFADDLPLLEWLEKQVFPMEAKLLPEHIYLFSKIAIMEYLTSGITTNFDMYFNPEIIAKASIDCGFRTVLCGGIDNFYGSISELEDWYIKFNNYNELISYKIGFHAEYTCSEELLKQVSKLGKKYNTQIFTHCSESIKETEDCISRTGKTPIQYLNSLDMFENGGGIFHGVQVNNEDMKILKEKNIYVITNPGSNCKLASGIAPIYKMLNNKIKIGIGTDGAASNNCLDFFREMFLVTALQKIKENDAKVVDPFQVLDMATKVGASAIGIEDCDSIKVGKLADLIVIDLKLPNMQPINNILKNIVYSGSKLNVKLTMVNGKILYRDGKFNIGVNPDEIYDNANKIVKNLLK